MVLEERLRIDHVRRKVVQRAPCPAGLEFLHGEPTVETEAHQRSWNGASIPKGPVAVDFGRVISKRNGRSSGWKRHSEIRSGVLPATAGFRAVRNLSREVTLLSFNRQFISRVQHRARKLLLLQLLHPDLAALRAFPLPPLVLDVSLDLFYGDFALSRGHASSSIAVRLPNRKKRNPTFTGPESHTGRFLGRASRAPTR